MSLATRCPECGTTFKVVRDQLRISDGWVRCGRCSHVFDGTEHLHDPEAAVVEAAQPETPRPVATPTIADIDFFNDTLLRLQSGAPSIGDGEGDRPSIPMVITDHIPQPPRTQPVTLEAPTLGWPSFNGYASTTTAPVIEFPADEASASSPAMPRPIDTWSRLPSLHLGDMPRRAEASAPDAVPDTAPSPDAEDGEPAAVVTTASEPVEPAAAAAEMPALFTRQRRSRVDGDASEHLGDRRDWPWRTLSVVALLMLVAQLVYQERSAIVARQPAWRPAFASACEMLGCQLAALQRIADISIDGASFAREKGGEGYQLSFTLRNRADMPLAMPAVELSLIDLQERTVVRRVLRPADYGAPAVIAARGERTALLPMALAGDDAAALPRVAGFHLDAFYP